MATTIQDFVDSIATKAGVDPATAETAIGTIYRQYNRRETRQKLVNCSTKSLARQILLKSILGDAAQARGYLDRLWKVPAFLSAVGERAVAGTAAGRTAVAHLVDKTIVQADRYLADPEHDPFLVPAPPAGWDGAAAFVGSAASGSWPTRCDRRWRRTARSCSRGTCSAGGTVGRSGRAVLAAGRRRHVRPPHRRPHDDRSAVGGGAPPDRARPSSPRARRRVRRDRVECVFGTADLREIWSRLQGGDPAM